MALSRSPRTETVPRAALRKLALGGSGAVFGIASLLRSAVAKIARPARFGALGETLKREASTLAAGYSEHAWAGRFLITVGGLFTAGLVAGAVLLLFGAVRLAAHPRFVAAQSLAALYLAYLLWLGIREIARFSPSGRKAALGAALGGILGGGVHLCRTTGGVMDRIGSLLGIALAVQVAVYFLRNGYLFRSQGDDSEEA